MRRGRSLVGMTLLPAIWVAGCLEEATPRGELSAVEARQLPSSVRSATRERLRSLGYSGATGEAAGGGGVIRHVETSVQPGLNLWSSGHGAIALLSDLDGRVVHRWRWPARRRGSGRYTSASHTHWERVQALPNGDLLALFQGASLVRLDFNADLRWGYVAPVHDDFAVLDSGEIVVLAAGESAAGARDEQLIWLSSEGAELRRLSLAACLADSGDAALRELSQTDLVASGLLVLDDAIVVSLASPPAIAGVDPEAGSVAWLETGRSDPSEPRWIDPHGRMLTFDRSSARRLPNGNTLLADPDLGRAREVAVDGEVVWEFESPIGMGPARAYRASVLDMQRLPVEAVALPARSGR